MLYEINLDFARAIYKTCFSLQLCFLKEAIQFVITILVKDISIAVPRAQLLEALDYLDL